VYPVVLEQHLAASLRGTAKRELFHN